MSSRKDPHQNAFFYYSGQHRPGSHHDRQIEDNTTKALINTLELSAQWGRHEDILYPFLRWIGVKEPGTTRFALQRATIGPSALKRARQRILLGVAPVLSRSSGEKDVTRASRPDAWIWGRTFAVLLETKIAGTFDQIQLAAHRKVLRPTVKDRLVTWHDLYGFIHERYSQLQKNPSSNTSVMLLDELLSYLRVLAYQMEIDMVEFKEFPADVFDAFHGVEDEIAVDARHEARQCLINFVEAVRKKLPPRIRSFRHLTRGVIRKDQTHVWATLSRREKPIDEPHFSFALNADGLQVSLLLEGAGPTKRAFKAIRSEPEQFLKLLRKFPSYVLELRRRWQRQARLFLSAPACRVHLDAVGSEDIDYLIHKMRALGRREKDRGLFELKLVQLYPRTDPLLRSAKIVTEVKRQLRQLHAVDQFLTEV